VTDLNGLWLGALQQVVGLAAHEVKDALNGVALNLEVLRSRLGAGKGDPASHSSFATAASEQFETLTTRTESLLFLARPPKSHDSADVAVTLKHLAILLVPAAKADRITLTVEGYDVSVSTPATFTAVRLALASGLLALIKEGGVGSCQLVTGSETVVRFSHESARIGDLDPALASALGTENIRVSRSGKDLLIAFPGNT
jgi:hypothetical protein